MRLSRTVRQVIGAAIGAAIAGTISITLALPAVERHEQRFGASPASEVAP